MTAARILFVLSLFGLFGALNALWRPNHERSWVLRPWWLFATLTGELIPLRIVIHGLLVVVLTALGALDHRAGRVAIWLTAATWALYVVLLLRAARTKQVVAASLDEQEISRLPARRRPTLRIMTGYPYRVPNGVERAEIEYAPGLQLDVYRGSAEGRVPALVHVHGGSWLARREPPSAGPADAA